MKIRKLFITSLALFCPAYACSVVSFGAEDDAANGNYYISRSEDDAEEGTNGKVDLANEDLDLGQLSGFESAAKIGIRFDGIRIPSGTKVKRAWLRFTKEGNRVKSKPTKLTLRAELTPNAESFRLEPKNISSRELTAASVVWSPRPWDPKKSQDERPQTPNLSALVQEVVDQEKWQAGNALVLIISGTGERDAMSFDGGGKDGGPTLHIESEE